MLCTYVCESENGFKRTVTNGRFEYFLNFVKPCYYVYIHMYSQPQSLFSGSAQNGLNMIKAAQNGLNMIKAAQNGLNLTGS